MEDAVRVLVGHVLAVCTALAQHVPVLVLCIPPLVLVASLLLANLTGNVEARVFVLVGSQCGLVGGDPRPVDGALAWCGNRKVVPREWYQNSVWQGWG